MKNGLKFPAALCLIIGLFTGFSSPPADAETIQWNLSLWGEKRAWTRPVHLWADAMATQTKGAWKIRIHYRSKLAPAADNWDGIKAGKFEAAGVCMAYSPEKVSLHTVQELPFIAPDGTEDIARMWIALWEHPAMLKELLRWNAVPLLPAGDSQTQLMGTQPVRTVSDLNRRRIRAGGEIANVLKRFGAATTMMVPEDAYKALGRGTIDLVAMPWAYGFGSYKIHEVSKYATDKISLGTTGCVFIANKDAWDALPDGFKKLHQNWYDQAPEAWKAAYSAADKKWVQIFKKRIDIVAFPEREREKLVFRAREVYDAWRAAREAEGLPGKEILEYYLRKREALTGK